MKRLRGILRILDANLNRAREAARVAEEYARFVLDDPEQAGRLKGLRHGLRELAERLGTGRLLAGRDTPGDVGTGLRTPAEAQRGSAADVAAAALKRLQEALRAVEEYAKLGDPSAAAAAEALRYEAYAIESALFSARRRLDNARLCVIVTGTLCKGRDPADVAAGAARGGAEMIQLREKGMDDASLLELARRVRRTTSEHGVLFIVNDRADVAAASEADGVHLGRHDLPPGTARDLLGPGAVVGVSTRSVEEARQAVADGADYLGVGTVFETRTKPVEQPAGPHLLRSVAAEVSIPFFAIGGVSADNLPSVLEAGAARVAVCGAILSADDVEAATRRIRSLLPADKGEPAE